MEKIGSGCVLGLDIGASSVGWALLKMTDGKASGIARAGVRVFDAAATGVFETGRTQPPGQARRTARLMRRQTERRARRLHRLWRTLQQASLLPEGGAGQVIPFLDATILEKYVNSAELAESIKARLPDVFPYWLRAQALDRKLERYEVGRALYNLGQRRGFLSNRKAAPKKDEDTGVVKKRITELRQALSGQTLGQYFSKLNPHEVRIRTHYTQRDMFLDEFERIWTTQAAHHPDAMTAKLKRRVRRAIFFQRPLKSAKGMIGPCEFEPGRRRAARATLEAQRFRVLQQVNNVEIIDHVTGEIARLTPEQRHLLTDALQGQSEMSFGGARKLLGLSGKRHFFNLEEGGEKKLIGNRSNAALRAVFGERWDRMTEVERERVIQDVLSVRQDNVLERRAQEVWTLPPESASKLAGFSPEPGYVGLSRHAIRKLLPLMEEGLRYSEAVDKVYGFGQRNAPVELLPPVAAGLPHLRNPVVHRVLAEVRKVVNGIIREHGKPQLVRIELARDLKRTADQRKEAWKRNLDNRRAREEASVRVLRETNDVHPSRRDIEKALLWDECEHVCPYTGKSINFSALFGPSPEFDIEHIVPFSRSLDDSFFNKTLCFVKENREQKRNQTPWEAYGADPSRWNDIIERVKRFRGDARIEKLRRFQLRAVESLDDFASQQLNDTRQASKEALRYLGLLYGGFWDESGVRRVQASKGGITAYLRDVWDLGSVLGYGDGGKSRSDHRHHAVDAIAVALTEPGIVNALSGAAVRALRERRRRFGHVEEPWAGFIQDVRRAVEGIVVSHRPERKVGGPLHAETLYSKTHSGPDGQPYRHIRRPLSGLKKEADIDAIVDPVVRNILREKLGKLGGDLKKLAAAANPPCLKDGIRIQNEQLCAPCAVPCLLSSNGRGIPIKSVRMREHVRPVQIGQGARTRFALTETNHHMEIVEEQGKAGPHWLGLVVSRKEAMSRQAGHPQREAVVRRDHGPNKAFKFSLAVKDAVEITPAVGPRRLMIVRGISDGEIALVSAQDARKKTDIIKEKGFLRPAPDTLRKWGCRKVEITPTGQVTSAHD